MIPTLSLRNLKPLPPSEEGRERTAKALNQWLESQERLEKICAEKGIPVPVLVC